MKNFLEKKLYENILTPGLDTLKFAMEEVEVKIPFAKESQSFLSSSTASASSLEGDDARQGHDEIVLNPFLLHNFEGHADGTQPYWLPRASSTQTGPVPTLQGDDLFFRGHAEDSTSAEEDGGTVRL